MHLIIFGATGDTGRCLIERALARGHQVRAVARTPAKLDLHHPALEVVRGDVTDPASIAPLLAGQDAVLSALGAPVGREPVMLYSQGISAILAAMALHGVQRIACVSAGGTKQGTDSNNPWFFEHVITPLLLARIFDDMRRMEGLLMDSNTAWTILRPPQLLNTPATGRYRVAPAYSLPHGRQIARADLADLMLDAVEQGTYIRTAVAVAY
ncbi:MAG TPA: SDR family oxidoreductase [Kouleothrix sp.]|jgi:uncharacterized protein YbjT (DUF2867 family)|nr:SDR family oxidoreductase [Kouleothrix sp.]